MLPFGTPAADEIENQDGATKVARNNAALRLGHQRLRVIGSLQKTNIIDAPNFK
jgi:hypothetical protein